MPIPPACPDAQLRAAEQQVRLRARAVAASAAEFKAQLIAKRVGGSSHMTSSVTARMTPEEEAQLQAHMFAQAREAAKQIPSSLQADIGPSPLFKAAATPTPSQQLPTQLPNPLQLQLPAVGSFRPYLCRQPAQRLSSIADSIQVLSQKAVDPVAVHAAAAVHALGVQILSTRRDDIRDAAVLSIALKQRLAKPSNKHFTAAMERTTYDSISSGAINAGVRALSADSAFMSALRAELSRLSGQGSTAVTSIPSGGTMAANTRMAPSSNTLKRSRLDDPADLGHVAAHMGSHVMSSGQDAQHHDSAGDVEFLGPVKKKTCRGIGQASGGAVSQAGDSGRETGDYFTASGDLVNQAAMAAGVPFNPTSGSSCCCAFYVQPSFL